MTTTTKIGAAVLGVAILLGAIWYFAQPSAGGSYDYTNADDDMVKLDIIKPGNVVLPQFAVTGEARGMWYFEGSFPIEVLGADGTVLVQVPAAAVTDWMTENFVPFRATIDLGDYSGPATLILKRDNPSGLPENDASLRVPIDVLDVQ